MIPVVHPGYGSGLFTHPESWIQRSKRHRILTPDPQHWGQLTLAGSVEEHETVFRSDEQVHAPQRRTQDLRVEPLLVFSKYKENVYKIPVFRLRTGSGINQVSGSGIRNSDPDPGVKTQREISRAQPKLLSYRDHYRYIKKDKGPVPVLKQGHNNRYHLQYLHNNYFLSSWDLRW